MEKVISIKGKGDIHYWVSVPKEYYQTLVFLPGLTADHRLFDAQIRYFNNHYRTIVWDAPAHYFSRPWSLDFSLIELKNRGLSWVFLFTFIECMIYMPLSTMFPILVMQHYEGSEMQAGVIQILWGIGFLIGGVILGIKTYKMNRIVVVNIAYLVMGLMFALMGLLSPELFLICLVAAFIGGLGGAVYVSLFTSVMQTEVVPQALGRVFSMYLLHLIHNTHAVQPYGYRFLSRYFRRWQVICGFRHRNGCGCCCGIFTKVFNSA